MLLNSPDREILNILSVLGCFKDLVENYCLSHSSFSIHIIEQNIVKKVVLKVKALG